MTPSATPSLVPSPTAIVSERIDRHTATRLADGRVLVAGGIGSSGKPVATAQLFDPKTGKWEATGSMADARHAHTATLLADGRVLVTGGFIDDGGPCCLTSSAAELFDPKSGTWTVTGSMVKAHEGHTATLLTDGRVLVAGGNSRTGGPRVALTSAEVYDPNSGKWTAISSMRQPHDGHMAARLADGRVLVAGGFNDGGLTSVELYDPSSGRWTAAGDMAEEHTFGTATLLVDGRVLAAGGDGPAGESASVELYDPNAGTWAATRRIFEARSGHAATLMTDGKVLVTGGTNIDVLPGLTTSALYDPGTGRWTATGKMNEAYSGHTATLLADGRVLVVGGHLTELYDPATGIWTVIASPIKVGTPSGS